MQHTELLTLRNITKTFPGVTALSNVDLVLKSGQIHCLAGENGSGKSTLVKIASGVYTPDSGYIRINGREYTRLTPSEAMAGGVQVIYQDLALFEHMTIGENIALNKIRQAKKRIITNRDIEKIAREAISQIGVDLDIKSTIREVSISNRQITAICRALALEAKILFMDEPTTALTHREIDVLLSIVNDLKAKGLSIVFISHKFDEIFKISDTITVFRDGCKIDDFPRSELTKEKLSFYMTGRTVKYPHYEPPKNRQAFFKVHNLTKKGYYKNISFDICSGDILGFIGRLGAGRTELALSLFGLNRPDAGTVTIGGKLFTMRSPGIAKKEKIALLPENRLSQSLFLERSVNQNISSAVIDMLVHRSFLFDVKKERQYAQEAIKNLNIKPPDILTQIQNLSGGNQQKAVIAKWLATNPKLFIMDSPTVGVDIGSKAEIYEIIQNLAKQNMSIILISDEIEEILCNCNKVIVMTEGECIKYFDETELAQPNIKNSITEFINEDYEEKDNENTVQSY